MYGAIGLVKSVEKQKPSLSRVFVSNTEFLISINTMLTKFEKMVRQIFGLIKHGLDTFLAEVKLFWDSPREYLYLFRYPTHVLVALQQYDPSVTQLGFALLETVQYNAPELAIHFIGSAVLGIYGKKDIDLYAESKPEDMGKYRMVLQSLFGPPVKVRHDFVEWSFTKNECDINLVLADPLSHVFTEPMRTFEVLKDNPRYIEEYEQLKIDYNGKSVREYHKARLKFFNRILREARDRQ